MAPAWAGGGGVGGAVAITGASAAAPGYLAGPTQPGVQQGDEGLAALLARDINVSSKTWEEHAVWYRNATLKAAADGAAVAKPKPRRSIFYLPMLSPYHWAALWWGAFMLLVDLGYTAFWVPLGIAFCTESFGQWGTGCTAADLLGGSIYMANLLLSLQVGVVLRHKHMRTQVLDGPLVLYYLLTNTGRFWLDVLCVVPLIYILVLLGTPSLMDAAHSATSLVGILSLMRMVRLLRLVSLSTMVVNNTLSGRFQDLLMRFNITVSTMYTCLLIYCLAVILNLEACIMLLIAYLEGLDNSWLTSVSWEDFTTVSEPAQWYASVYWVITTSTTTGYGDFVPHSVVEQVFCNLFMIIGMVMFGLLVGTVANALTRASASATQLYRFRKKMTAVGSWLNQHSIPPEVQKQIKDYFSDVWVASNEVSLDSEIFSELPAVLRAKVAQYITIDMVIRVHLFHDQEDGLQGLVAAALKPVDLVAGHDVCRQGQEGDRLWICAEGELQALQHQSEPAYPRVPCLLGESVLLGDELPAFRLRPWTLRARGKVKLWELKMSDLGPIIRMYPRLREDLVLFIRKQLLTELGFNDPSAGKTSVLEHSWCESVASVAEALLKQSASVVDAAAAELRAARLEDGSLLMLLDGLLEFSTMRSKRITLMQPPQPTTYDVSTTVGGGAGLEGRASLGAHSSFAGVDIPPAAVAAAALPVLTAATALPALATPPGGFGGAPNSSAPVQTLQLTTQSSMLISMLPRMSSRPAISLQHTHSDSDALTAVILSSSGGAEVGTAPLQPNQAGGGGATTTGVCSSCGRAVCSTCRRSLVTGVPVVVGPGAAAQRLGAQGAGAAGDCAVAASSGGGNPSAGLDAGAASMSKASPPPSSMQQGVPPAQSVGPLPTLPPPPRQYRSVLLSSLGLHGATHGLRGTAWRPVARSSQWQGMSTVSMVASGAQRRNGLSMSSIPQENFGDGYGPWG